MAELLIHGGAPLCGEITIQGAKNSALPILAATLLTRETCVLEHVPRLTDVDASCAILRHLGARVERGKHTLTVTAGEVTDAEIPDALMRAMRSSILFVGPLLARTGRAACALPGGCQLGPRPIDLHLEALRALGVSAEQHGDYLVCRGRPRAGVIRLRYPSVGATENALMAAVCAPGVSRISGAACEPEIGDLAAFLRALGARIAGDGTPEIEVEGVKCLHGARHRIMPDRIVAATYLSAVAAAGGEAVLRGAREAHLLPVVQTLRRAGAQIDAEEDRLIIRAGALRTPGTIETAPYPGFPTDAQAPIMAALLRAEGRTVIHETVFSARFAHVPQLRRLGAQIVIAGRLAEVTGTARLHGTHLHAPDLRGGAAIIAAALGAEGESRVTGLSHVDRGYEDIARDLRQLGASVERVEISEETVHPT